MIMVKIIFIISGINYHRTKTTDVHIKLKGYIMVNINIMVNIRRLSGSHRLYNLQLIASAGGHAPTPPSMGMLRMHVCFAHTMSIHFLTPEHVNCLGPGIKYSLVTPLVTYFNCFFQ